MEGGAERRGRENEEKNGSGGDGKDGVGLRYGKFLQNKNAEPIKHGKVHSGEL